MSWWKIKDIETGRVDLYAKTAAKTANALPGQEDISCLFNGDEPADIMGLALRDISKAYYRAWKRPATKEELLAVFNFCRNGMFR